ncbi:hypothetical protein KM043_000119, partial [Ampulex compressa]
PPPPPGSRHTLGSPRNSPRVTRKHQQVSASLATTPTQSTLSPDFGPEGFPSSNSRPGGLDRVLLERNLERLLQERGSHPEENRSELGRCVDGYSIFELRVRYLDKTLNRLGMSLGPSERDLSPFFLTFWPP